jgi:hypothetical protein
MSLRNALLGATVAVALAVPAFAGETAMTGSAVNSVVIHTMDGKTSIVPITAERQAELIASPHAHQLAQGIVVLVANGKTYVIDDHKQANGQQMVQAIIDNSANGP